MFDSRSRIRLIIQAVEQIREGVGPDGNWMIDLHQKFDFHEAVEVCRLMEPSRPFCVEDPVREEQFRTQIPKLRLLTTVPLAPGEEWGTRAEFSPLVEQRDIDFARASLPNVGGITEMLKIMAVCDTHKVGIVPHFTGPIATAGHMHTMMAFPGQVLMEYNQGDRPVPYMPEFLECRNGKVWPNDRPGLGVSVDEKQLTFIEAMTEAAPGRRIGGPTARSRTGNRSFDSAGGVNAGFIPRCAMAIRRARSLLLTGSPRRGCRRPSRWQPAPSAHRLLPHRPTPAPTSSSSSWTTWAGRTSDPTAARFRRPISTRWPRAASASPSSTARHAARRRAPAC